MIYHPFLAGQGPKQTENMPAPIALGGTDE